MRQNRVFGVVALTVFTGLLGCGEEIGPEEDDLLPEDGYGKADGPPAISDDGLNGLWTVNIDGQDVSDLAVIESWPAVGIRLHLEGQVHQLSRSSNALSADSVSLTIEPNDYTSYDDAIHGTVGGRAVYLERDTAVKPAITLALPGDRSYREYLTDMLMPAAQRDRESYVQLTTSKLRSFLKSCVLYRTGSWQRKFIKGTTSSERNANFDKIITAVANLKTTPHSITRSRRFSDAVTSVLKDPSQAGLAISTFGMYFSTAGGRSVRIPITSDSIAYFITDKPARAEKIGLVVMKTPTHGPLASTFGRQLLDLAAMTPADDLVYARTMMEMLVKSDASRATQLSPSGRSALTDWFAVMAIEDYRGVAFGWPDLDWGLNMTNVQFYGLVSRALARPGQTDSAGNPIVSQVIVGYELRPGDPSYADVLNNGNDMQEYQDMSTLKLLASDYLRQTRPELVARVEAAFAQVTPVSELGSRDRDDIFRFVTRQLYDDQGRTANLRGAAADEAVNAVTDLVAALIQDSAGFEAYILANGYTKSNQPAPKSTGF